jgi:hypothetical protein
MIPFGTGDIPSNGNEAAARIASAISTIVNSRTVQPAISCEMPSPEQISNLSIDLTNIESAASRARRPASLATLGATLISSFRVIGNPVMVYGAPVSVDISGSGIPATWSRDDQGNLWLVPTDAPAANEGTPASGTVEISARTTAVESALRSAISEIAEANGARLKDLRLRVESAGERAVVVAVDVAAAKFMMTAKVRALAEASLDDNMNLRIGHIDLTGEGTAGGMVANLLAGKVAQWRGREIPLAQYMFAGAALRDVQLHVGEDLRLGARFGG